VAVSVTYKKLVQKLREEKERLTKGLEQLRVGAPKSSDSKEGSLFGKKEEEASEATEFERRLALEERLRSLLEGVEQALVKFAEGTYGLCDACGQQIPPERMEALPQARLCLSCKAQEGNIAKSRLPPK
jgi:RNA polymerase-binding protein DksA